MGAKVWLKTSGQHYQRTERLSRLRFDMCLSSHNPVKGLGRSCWVEIERQVGIRPHEQRGRGLDDRGPVGHDYETRPGKA